MIENKIAVITGASGGIGYACAERFINEGAKVVLSDVNDEAGEKAAAGLRESGGDAIYVHCDVSSKAQVEELFDSAILNFGRVDCAIANAGIVHPADILELEEEDFDRVISVRYGQALVATTLEDLNREITVWRMIVRDQNSQGLCGRIRACHRMLLFVVLRRSFVHRNRRFTTQGSEDRLQQRGRGDRLDQVAAMPVVRQRAAAFGRSTDDNIITLSARRSSRSWMASANWKPSI